MGEFKRDNHCKYYAGCSLLLLLVAWIPLAHATIPDGTYQATSVSGQYATACSGPSVPITPFSGATATLTVSGSNVSFSIVKSGEFSYSGSGTQNTSTLNLSGTGEVTTAPGSGGPTAPEPNSVSYSLSGTDVSISSFNFFGINAPALCDVFIDFNGFTMILNATPSSGSDPGLSPSSHVTSSDTENLDRAISTFVVPVQNRTRNFHLQSLRGNQGVASNINPSLIQNGLMLEGSNGMNAGDSAVLYGFWTSYSYSDFENDFVSTRYDGDRHTVMAGLDVSPWERTLFGVAVGWEDSSYDTDFNLGEQDTDGFTIFPYFGGLLTDTWSVDFGFGYSSLDTDQFRTDPSTATIISSSPDTDRWFGMLNLNGLTTYGNWIIGGRIGFLYAQEEQDSFVESNGTVVSDFKTELGQWNLGGDVAYSYGNFEPYAKLTYENDFNSTESTFTGGLSPRDDDDNFIVGAGVRYFNNKNVSGYIDWYKRLGREDVDEDTFTLSIRVDF